MTIKRGDIYFADLTPTTGSEQGGVRPVLVIQNDTGNKYSPTVIVAAITGSRDKHHIPTHILLKEKVKGLYKDSTVLLEQIRTIDRKRLREFIGRLDEENMKQIDHAIAISVGMNNSKIGGGV